MQNKSEKRPRGTTKPEIVQQIIAAFPAYKSDYIFWKYCPEAIVSNVKANCTFAELKKATGMPESFTEQVCAMWLLDDGTQSLV